MNLTSRQQILGLVAMAGVALLVGDRLVFTPLMQSWKARATKLAELRRNVDQGEQLIRREDSIRGSWERMRTNTLPAEPSVAENQLLKAFDRWSLDSRVGVSAIKPQVKRGNDDRQTLECRVDAFGNLSAISRFLFEIERDPIGVKIEAVELASRDDAGEQLTLGLLVNGLLLTPTAASKP